MLRQLRLINLDDYFFIRDNLSNKLYNLIEITNNLKDEFESYRGIFI